MVKLPAKEILDGTKVPKTTTGEIKDAFDKLRDYLGELLGEDSTDKEAARKMLGVDLARREETIGKKGMPVGTVAYFATATPPAGYQEADGMAVGRTTCPDLFDAIGTTFGEGDGETTFNLPDLMGRFAEGSVTPGVEKASGLPNIAGLVYVDAQADSGVFDEGSGALFGSGKNEGPALANLAETSRSRNRILHIDASRSSPVYGPADTVQPPVLTLLPCIKALDVAMDSGLIDVTQLAQDVAGKADKTDCFPVTGGTLNGNLYLETVIGFNRTDGGEAIYVDGSEKGIVFRTGTGESNQHFYHFTRDGHIRADGMTLTQVVATYDDGSNWWRMWRDGWLEPGGLIIGNGMYGLLQLTFPFPFSRTVKWVSFRILWGETWYTDVFGANAQASTDIVGMPCAITLTGCKFQSFSSRA